MPEKISLTQAINVSWERMKNNFWFFVGLLVITWLAQVIPTGIAEIFKERMFLFYMLLILASWVLQIIIRMGIIKITMDVIDKGKGNMADLFSSARSFLNFIAGAILYSLIVIAGFILLIIPGIIWSIKYQFFAYLIVDKNMGPIEALKKSGEITMGNKWKLFLLGLLLMLINLVGLLCLVVGLFATIPIAMLATAYVYRKLMGEIADAAAPAETIAKAPGLPVQSQ